jgi:hypothetical protein
MLFTVTVLGVLIQCTYFIGTGDVVTPGFITYYMNCEDIFRKPYGAGEMNMFNFAYNLLTLKFKKANQQLDPEVLSRALDYLNVGKNLISIHLLL